jgi:uncharacterized protein YggE
MMKVFTLPLVLAISSSVPVAVVSALVARSPTKEAASPSLPGSLNVTGDAQVRVVPDKATFTAVVEGRAKDKVSSQRAVQERMAKVLDAARGTGISATGLSTAGIQLAPEYEIDARGRPLYLQVKAWTSLQRITVCVDDLHKMNDVFGAILNAGASLEGDVIFDTSRLEEIRGQARLLASKAAREKATTLLSVLGGTLGKPTRIDDGAPTFTGPLSYKNAVEDWRNGGITEGAFSAGQMLVSAHVGVAYAIDD